MPDSPPLFSAISGPEGSRPPPPRHLAASGDLCSGGAWSGTYRGRTRFSWDKLHGRTLGPRPPSRPRAEDRGSPTEMGWKVEELFPALLWALHSYVLLCSKVSMTQRLWTVTWWKGCWLRTLGCGSSKTSSTWASSHLERAECGSEFRGAQPLIPGEEGDRRPLTCQYGPCTPPTSRWAGGTQRHHRAWHQSH